MIKKRILGTGLTILLVFAMLLVMAGPNLLAAQVTPTPGNAAFPGNEKIEVLIGFHGPPNRGLVEAFGGEVYAEFTIVDVIAAQMTQQQTKALARNPLVSYVELDAEVYAIGQEVPWGIDRVFGTETYSFHTWGSSRGSSIGVAVLDTGIDRNHEDLKVVGGIRFYTQGIFLRSDDKYDDGHGHGTHVAGTIAALDNDRGVVGVAPSVDLYAVKVLGDNGSGSVSAIVAGIQWVVDNSNISIINMSLGSSSYSQTFKDACDQAFGAGVLLVSSAGNSGNKDGTEDNVGYPAKYESVIAVAASDSNDQRASFSSTGPAVELIAPGVGIKSTVPGGYATYNGTSMASPHVAGVAALVWAADPSLTNVQVRAMLQDNVEDLNLPKDHQGEGLVRADLAVAAVMDTGQNPGTYTLTLETSPPEGGTAKDNTSTGPYEAGAVVNLEATANNGYEFVNWTEGETVISTSATFNYTMPEANTTLIANFNKPQEGPTKYTLTLVANPSNGGTVTDDTGEGSYEAGAEVSVTATANADYEFVNWTADGVEVSTYPTFNYTMPVADTTLTANFDEIAELPIEGKVIVQPIVYSESGGRDNNRHLHVTISLTDDLGNWVSGASVSITLERNELPYATVTGSTNSSGSVTFSFNNAPSGIYSTWIDDVSAMGLTWDKLQPEDPTVAR